MDFPKFGVGDLSLRDFIFFYTRFDLKSDDPLGLPFGLLTLGLTLIFIFCVIASFGTVLSVKNNRVPIKSGIRAILLLMALPILPYALMLYTVPSTIENNIAERSEDLLDIDRFSLWYKNSLVSKVETAKPDTMYEGVQVVGMHKNKIDNFELDKRFRRLMEHMGFKEYYTVEYLKEEDGKFVTVTEDNVLLFTGEELATLSTYSTTNDGSIDTLPRYSTLKLSSGDFIKYTDTE